MVTAPVAGSFLIFLREGIEGSMICTILLTYLAAGGRRDLFRWVLGGAAVALVISAAAGTVLYVGIKSEFVGTRRQTWFETGTFALAVIVLTYMTFWMKRHARRFSAELKARVDSAVTAGSALALFTVALITVGREALETSIFLVAIAFQSTPAKLVTGAVPGLAVALAISFAIYRLGLRINIARFFTVVGAALMVVAAGLLANLVENLQNLGVLPGAGAHMWDTGGLVSDQSVVGDILHGLLGYAASPTLLQLTSYVLFLAVGLTVFLRRPRTSAARA
jgi:high-affinity iron transporter